ncbi:MAG: ATP-binding protein [Acidimicrobiia bacterium]
MMSDLAEQLGTAERDDVEWKRDAEDRDLLRKAVCALANDLPRRGLGHLLVGVDKNGGPTGLPIDEQLILRIVEFRDDGRILPRPVITVEKAVYAGVDVLHVTVEPSFLPPVRFDNVVWVRVGASTRKAHAAEERVLSEKRRAGNLPFDQQPIPGASLEDLDLELFRSTYLPAAVDAEVLASNERPLSAQLASLRLLDPPSEKATVLGLLIVGLDPTAWVPGAYVQFVRYDGKEPSDNVVDHEELRANLIGQLDVLGRLLTVNIRTAIEPAGGLRQEDHPDYPLPALRELVLNAIIHRTYDGSNAPVRILWFDDRVEITSPGGPFGVVNRDNFDSRNDYRNPALAAAMKQLGFVNRFGRGITLVRNALEQNGNPPAEFGIEDNYWGVTVGSAR